MSFGLDPQIIASTRQILSRHSGIERAIIYGSRAKGTYRRGSDIDLTLVGTTLTYDDLVQIIQEFDDSLIPYKIDLSLWHFIRDPAVRSHIERRGKVLYDPTLSGLKPH